MSELAIGFGVDVVDAKRIKRASERFGARFLDRVFSESEREYCMTKKKPELHLAARFGAKEAFIKAIGTRRGMRWIDVEVVRSDGAPTLKLHRAAKELADKKGVETIHLTMAHEADLGIAGVILEGAAKNA